MGIDQRVKVSLIRSWASKKGELIGIGQHGRANWESITKANVEDWELTKVVAIARLLFSLKPKYLQGFGLWFWVSVSEIWSGVARSFKFRPFGHQV